MKLKILFKYVIVVLFSALIISCAKSKGKSDNVKAYNFAVKDIIASNIVDMLNLGLNKPIEYISTANGVALIELKVKPDNSFSLYMKLLGQPGTNDTNEQYTFPGAWTKDSNKIYFTFKGDKPYMKSFFAKGDTVFEVLSDSSFCFRYKFTEFNFYGVACELKK